MTRELGKDSEKRALPYVQWFIIECSPALRISMRTNHLFARAFATTIHEYADDFFGTHGHSISLSVLVNIRECCLHSAQCKIFHITVSSLEVDKGNRNQLFNAPLSASQGC